MQQSIKLHLAPGVWEHNLFATEGLTGPTVHIFLIILMYNFNIRETDMDD